METKEKNRKTYKKPQVNKVKLETEEAVLQACKTISGDTAGKLLAAKWCGNAGCKTELGS